MILNNRVFLLASLIMAFCAALFFTPGLPGAFLFDDIPNIVNNQAIHLSSLTPGALLELLASQQVSGPTRSLPMLTFALDFWRSGGAEPLAFKTTNILIHGLTALALAFLLRSLLVLAKIPPKGAAWMALVLACIWAIHPLQVSSVLYAVQRLQTMGTFFLVLSLLTYVRGRQLQLAGQPGRRAFLLTGLFWLCALASKEDSILLPAYTLALELTLLRFGAANEALARRLRLGYLLAGLGALVLYSVWAVPHYWSWEAYAGRDFNSTERLLTQGRVLILYLWQILLPLPSQMSFYYDWIVPSRGLFAPWTTLPALLLIAALLGLAWRLRLRLPLFALGLFWFFAAHFITSNVIGLELAFEHRNHFALIGAVLALGAFVYAALEGIGARTLAWGGLAGLVLLGLGSATLVRAGSWRTAVSLQEANVAAAPSSQRAWLDLCDSRFQAGGGALVAHNPLLPQAIAACRSGADANADALNSLVVLLVLKTLDGSISPDDWERLMQRLRVAPMSWDNVRAPLIFLHYAGQGVQLDKMRVLEVLRLLDTRTRLKVATLAEIADGIMDGLGEPELALPYFVRVIEAMPPGDSYAWELSARLRGIERPDLARSIEALARARLKLAMPKMGREAGVEP